MIRGGHFWVGLSTDRACVVVRTYMLNVNTSEPYVRDKERPPTLFCLDQAMCLPSRAGEYVRSYVLKCQSKQ